MVRGCLLMGAPTASMSIVVWLLFPVSPFLASVAGLRDASHADARDRLQYM